MKKDEAICMSYIGKFAVNRISLKRKVHHLAKKPIPCAKKPARYSEKSECHLYVTLATFAVNCFFEEDGVLFRNWETHPTKQSQLHAVKE